MNNEKRKLGSFEKEMFKLMNNNSLIHNSFYGKTMENVRKRQDNALVKPNSGEAGKIISKPTLTKLYFQRI